MVNLWCYNYGDNQKSNQRRIKMKKTKETLQRKNNTKEEVLHLAFELSNTKWKLASSDGKKMRIKEIDARNLEQL